VTGKTLDLGLKQRARLFAVMFTFVSVCGCIALGWIDGRVSWWQCAISALGGMLLFMTPILWYLLCCAIVSAAKTLGDEVEQVWDYTGCSARRQNHPDFTLGISRDSP
jgi:hypothetical protein